jgi:cation:H+ antiporter
MSLETIVFFALGLGLLVGGADLLVRGASRLAAAFGISPLVIGLTVVAYGTSSPEMAVSVKSAFSGQADIAVGNAVGSNIFNVLFILGASAAITPLLVSSQLVRLEVPIMIGVSALTLLLAADGSIGRLDGFLLFAGAVAYTVFQIVTSRRESLAVKDEYAREYGSKPSSWARNAVLVLAGLGLLVLGSRWLVDGAVAFAQHLGVSELVIGLTIVAAGTSLPEVATSILAAFRGERDIAVGNVVGSNIFNLLGVLGLSGLVAPGGLPVRDALLHFDLPVMIAVAVACLPIFASGALIARAEGVLFLAYYSAYAAYLVLAAQQHDALPVFSAVMQSFVLPLTAVTLAVLSYRHWRRGAPAGAPSKGSGGGAGPAGR